MGKYIYFLPDDVFWNLKATKRVIRVVVVVSNIFAGVI